MMNPTQPHPPLTRKDIVLMLGNKVSLRQVRRHEKSWGLDKAKIPTRTRMVIYRHSVALTALRNMGFEV